METTAILPGAAVPHPRSSRRRLGDELAFWVGLAATFVRTTVFLLLCWVAAAVVLLGWAPTAVSSGSMSPAIRRGDIVLVDESPREDVGIGSVIRFRAQGGRPTLHRIQDIGPDGIVTRGDANPGADSTVLRPDQVMGVGVALVPMIGLPVVWLREGRWPQVAVFAVLASLSLGLMPDRRHSGDPWADDAPERLHGPFTARACRGESHHVPAEAP
jgi:signal peptidase